ncbi:hypothetical protein C064_00754 [Brucella suis 63/252]|uniref:Transposase for insertion sequence element IS6501 n=1 Tax=Brucella canis (strain ATCC 23365 / NCTC 10854 / RM-666) TaxID=483179 RepID=A9M935_BRUC2|nr:transposase for insertion sequence element IS6501 [Brucella canis ATCC 23365]AIJ71365.1 transposase DDE domain protein [Brucella suis bv. 3 str. 686]AIJ81600.1 transposase DDE domain protein [Brucella canis]AIJ98818.1 transposase DDE domain protein [Brucella suis]EEW91485.1 transposase [Brucella suis bv. 4 str. 40]ENQ57010.1 hypothetical protein C969_00457 [Brucella canis CNGB 1172]ENQ61634.1 hypothetical protein C979_02017 [Brucella canis UK10/02]ENR16437.1 hypothetical protein C064_0075
MAGEFWLDDQQWAVIAPLLPTNQPGAHRTDDRRVISGIIHVLRSGCRWQDCPACYGPPTTVYNRFHCWSAKGIWRRLFEALVQPTDRDIHMIDSTTAKAHRPAAGGKGGDAEAIGRSRGGRSTKIHAVVDSCGRPVALRITPGQRGDAPIVILLLDVSFQEVVHSERIEETGVTIPQFSRIAPNEHPQECPTDAIASRRNGGRSSRRQADEGAGCTPLWGLAENCFSLDRTVQDIWPGGDDGSLVAPHPQPPSNGPGHCRTDTPSSQTTPDR